MNVDVDVEKRAFRIAYVPVGVPTFHLETANALVSASRELLEGLAARAGVQVEVCAPEGICLSVEAAEAFLDGCLEAGPVELAVFQNATFANGAYMASVLERVGAPVLVWSLRDPAPDGGRLKLNSLPRDKTIFVWIST